MAEEYHDTKITNWDPVAGPFNGVVLEPSPPYTPGESFKVTIYVMCWTTMNCDLRGKTIRVLDALGNVVAEGTLDYAFSPEVGYTVNYGVLTVTAPSAAGTFTYTAVFPEQSPHAEARLFFTVR